MGKADEQVDVLVPPRFEPSGEVKTRTQALQDGNWLGTFNVWLYSIKNGEPYMLYQRRGLSRSWAPGLFDVSAAGHYQAGETGLDGLREVEEELGLTLDPATVDLWGRKLHVGLETNGKERHTVVSVYTAPFDGELEDLKLDPEEVEAVYWIPAKALLEIFREERTSLRVEGVDNQKQPVVFEVTVDSFPFNPDNYHERMAEHIALKVD